MKNRPAVYNEVDSFCCDVLRARIADGSLPPGDVDERDIREVNGHDYEEYAQIHLFAGIGGFGYAARLASFPDDFSLLTGGFPCQPWSVAGRRLGESDDRHLWPEMLRIIRQAHPKRVLGENVPGIDDKKYMALDGVLSDLEKIDYEGQPFEIPACGVGSPQRRNRAWIVAYPQCFRSQGSGARWHVLCATPDAYREASGLVDAFQREGLPFVCGRHDGVSNGVDRLKALGNAMDPHVAARILNSMD